MLFIMSMVVLAQLYGTSCLLRSSFKISHCRNANHVAQVTRKLSSSNTRTAEEITYVGFDFEILKTAENSNARLAVITTPHGKIECPNFIFCGTKAAMKGITTDQLKAEGAQIMLSNTYHMMINPGEDIVSRAGGLHKFMNWDGPVLTDSGGYQIFSMGHGSVSDEIKGRRFQNTTGTSNSSQSTAFSPSLLGITEQGATFRSHTDGRQYTLTPESSITIQKKLGADIILVLDECTPFHVSKEYTADSMLRSHRWALRSLKQFVGLNCMRQQALYGIVQGGVHQDLRRESCEFINSNPFFGTAIGGSLGASRADMYEVVSFTRSLVRNDRPVHLLGIGGVRDIFHGVRQGIDTFDCVHPTRLARHGAALVTAQVWDEVPCEETRQTGQTVPNIRKINDRARGMAIKSLRKKFSEMEQREYIVNLSDKMLHKHFPTEFTQLIEDNKKLLLQQYEQKFQAKKIGVPKSKPRDSFRITKSNLCADLRPIDPSCSCHTCKSYSRAYLHHLFTQHEILGSTLMTIHNVHFMNRLMADIRTGIATDTLDDVEKMYLHPDQSVERDVTGTAADN